MQREIICAHSDEDGGDLVPVQRPRKEGARRIKRELFREVCDIFIEE